MSNVDAQEASWEDLFDSGQLEEQLQELSVRSKESALASDQKNGEVDKISDTEPERKRTSGGVSSSYVAPVIVQSNDNAHLTQYRPPEPKVMILKRPSSSSSLEAEANSKPKPQPKTLRQREEEYAAARLRILGAASSDLPENNDAQISAPLKSTRGGTSGSGPKNNARTPKGPDGTKGFKGKEKK